MENPPSRDANINNIVRAQIVFLLSTLTEENFERNQTEIRSLSEQHGIDTYLHFLRRLISNSQTRLATSGVPAAFDPSTSLTFRLLVQESQRLARDPFLADRFRDGIDRGEGDLFRSFDLVRFADRIGLQPLERLILAASIVAANTRKELNAQARNLVRDHFNAAMTALLDQQAGGAGGGAGFDGGAGWEMNNAQLAKLMTNLLADPPAENPVLDAQQRHALIGAAGMKYGFEIVMPILHSILPNLSLPRGSGLIQTLVQLGQEVNTGVDCVNALLVRFGHTEKEPLTTAQVVDYLSACSRMSTETAQIPDVGVLIRAFATAPNADIDWPTVVKDTFDWPERHSVDTATLKLIVAILLNSPADADPHAVTGFWTTWTNPLYQLRLLDTLLSLPGDTFNFFNLPGRRIVTVDDVSIASPTIKSLAANVQGQTWNSLDLFDVLVRLAGSEFPELRNCVREMLDKAVKISAELVHMGLLQVPSTNWNETRLEYSQKLLAMFLAGHPNHQLVFMRLWQIKPSYLLDAFRDFYTENSLNITRILDVAQDLKILDSLLEVRPFTFALDVAALASRREYLNLDKWLQDHVSNYGAEFLHDVIQFLDIKMESEKATRISDPAVESRTMPLNPQTIAIFLRMLRNSSTMMAEGDVDYCLEIRNACLQIHPRLMTLTPGSDVEPGFNVVSYSAEVEGEVDAIYKQMYDEQITIDEVIAMLQRTKTSTKPHENEIFSCMLHFLFDEYKFFQAYYPPRELAMTGYLFGSLIQHQLVEFIPLGIAIRYVVDALNCPPHTNLFRFGIQALSRFENRLAEWQPLCQALLKIPHLLEERPDLAASIQRAIANGTNGTDARKPGADDLTPVFTAIQADHLDGTPIVPAEEVSDRILFIVNNLAPSNYEPKLREMREHFQDDYARWFAHYLVDQRVSTEPNNHALYLRFLDSLDSAALHSLILHETFVKSSLLLNAEKTVQSSSERAILKNVASWLGTITLARDRPIKHKNLSFKDLLIEGYDSQRLVVVIPFVCKTLEPCAQSRIFKPPNPWLMAVLGLLVELYHYAELKLNLKFEIEVLCGTLDVNLDTIEATTILRNRPVQTLSDLPDYVRDINALPMGGYDPSSQHLQGDTQLLHQLGAGGVGDSSRAVGAQIEELLGALSQSITISPQLAPFSTNHTFKHTVQMAIDRAVRDIILPVVERSVTIAGISTRELVTKDFATDRSEEKLRQAGHTMAQKLAGSLALVTSKEPLRTNLASHMRQLLTDHGFSEQMVPEEVIVLLVQDNIDIACAAIEQAAMDRARADIEEAFAASYEARRRHIQLRPNHPFWDPQAQQTTYPATLPDPLRIKPGGVQPHQASVYEDFGSDAKPRMTSRPGSTVSYGRNEPFGQQGYPPSPSHDQRPHMLTHQEAMERFNLMVRELDNVLLQLPINSLAALPPSHDVRQLLRQILVTAVECLDRNRTPLVMSQKIVQLLYKTPLQLGRETYAALLDQLCQTFDDVAKEAIAWLIYADDDRKFNVPVTVTLLRGGLINVAQQDQQLAKFLSNPRPSLQTFVARLIRECLTSDPQVASHQQFQFSLGALFELSQEGTAVDEVTALLDDLRGVRRPPVVDGERPTRIATPKTDTEPLREKMLGYFKQWVNIYQRVPKVDTRSGKVDPHFENYIRELNKGGVLIAEDQASFFFRVCAEAGVNHYVKCMTAGQVQFAFHALDAYARLVAMLVRFQGDTNGMGHDQAKIYYLTKILSIVILVLAHMHEEQGSAFEQKPYFRFFSSLINDLHAMRTALGTAYFRLLTTISDTFLSLQPQYFPGFAFSWMCLISHRHYMPNLLLAEHREGWASFHHLLLSLLKFLSPFLKTSDLHGAIQDLYRGALRLLLVLLHDFPEFLAEYYFSLCGAVPGQCVQLRNIILSAYPAGLPLPDPHANSIFDALPEMGTIPPVLSDFASGLRDTELRGHLDQYLLGRGNTSFLVSLKARIRPADSSQEGATDPYSIPFINSLVMYVGLSTVAQAKARSGASLFVPTDPGVVVLQYLGQNLDIEGQYHLVSAIVLHLRYPNAHTHWFSSLLLYMFLEVQAERFAEVMTRALLERLIVHRPHPWGAIATFVELLRNPQYDFANKDYVRVSPEVTLLFENVVRSIFTSG